ncbi:MAG: aldo/keto reductase [Myxococcaceae bacterium]
MTRSLGKTGWSVSVLGLGCGPLGDERIDEAEVARLLHGAVDLGVTVFDSARSYGLSEERLGRHLGARRAHVILSTKVGYGIPGFADWTGPCVTAGIDAALQRMQTDWVDVVHLHSCPLETLQHRDVVEALGAAQRAGKVRAAAYAGDNEALQWALESGRFGVVQCSVNVCDQRALESQLPLAAQRGVGVFAKRAAANSVWRSANAQPEYRERLGRMGFLGSATDDELLDRALRFTAFAPGVDCALVGTTRLAHLEQNVRSVTRGPLDPHVIEALRVSFRTHGAGWRAVT